MFGNFFLEGVARRKGFKGGWVRNEQSSGQKSLQNCPNRPETGVSFPRVGLSGFKIVPG